MKYVSSDLLSLVTNAPEIELKYDNIDIILKPHLSYMVARLEVYSVSNDHLPNCRRIFIGTTPVRAIAMHIQDCLEKSNKKTSVTWSSIMDDLHRLIEKSEGERNE